MLLKTILVFLTLISFLSMFLTERPIYFSLPFWASLFALSYIDIKTMKLPNGLNVAVFLLGVVYNVMIGQDWRVPVASCAIAAIVLISISVVYTKIRGRQGMGMGDIKLLAAGAVWISPYLLPIVLLFSSISAIIYAMLDRAGRDGSYLSYKLPYGPFLAMAIWFAWIFENQLLVFIL